MHLEIYGSSLLFDILFLFCTLSFPGGCWLDLVVIIISLSINSILYMHSLTHSFAHLFTLIYWHFRQPGTKRPMPTAYILHAWHI